MTTFLSQFTPYEFPLLGLVRLPRVTISPEDRARHDVKPNAGNVAFLKKLCWTSYLKMRAAGKFDDIDEATVIERLKFEFSVLQKTDTIDYILLIWDVCRWCDENKIPRGPGRGSVCGSLVCYLAGVTKVNSLRYNLSFTRFISETRVKPKVVNGITYADGRTMCDIDSDFSSEHYKGVLNYMGTKYPNRTAKIGTVAYYTGKTALKMVLKTRFEWTDREASEVIDLIEVKYGKPDSLEESADKPAYRAWLKRDKINQVAHDMALRFEGLAQHRGVHASGFFMCYDPLDETLPIQRAVDKEGDEFITTVYDMETVAKIGVKLDILKLKTLDAIKRTADLIDINPDDIDIDDPAIYDFLARSREYKGLFQIDTGIAGDTTFKARPKKIEQLSAAISIARPGSLKEIPTLIKYYETGEIKSIYPPIDAILKDTANIIIYQESINEICQRVYGLNADDAEEVSRAIRKKKREDIVKWEAVLREQGGKLGVPLDVTETFWGVCNDSADYLFSSCLSPDTMIETRDGDKPMCDVEPGEWVKAFDIASGTDHFVEVKRVIPSEADLYEVTLNDGRIIKASLKHQFLCADLIMRPLSDVVSGEHEVITEAEHSRTP